MTFPIVTLDRTENEKLVICDANYAPSPWQIGDVEIVGFDESLPEGLVTLSEAVKVFTDNQASIKIEGPLIRPLILKVNLSCGPRSRSFQLVLT